LPVAAPLTVVTYHYVRPVAESRFPALKALERSHFAVQLAWFAGRYTFVSWPEVAGALETGAALPERALLLTFDDGYLDHLVHCAPEMAPYGAKGLFFVVADAAERGRVLDVNKIQHVLAVAPVADVLAEIRRWYAAEADGDLPSWDTLRERYEKPSRFDDAPTAFVKKLLQRGLPEEPRGRLVDALFRRFVTADEAAFAHELYLDVAQARLLRELGHTIGSHAATHRWLDGLPAEERSTELERGMALLDRLGEPKAGRSICYPYGGYDAHVLEDARRAGFAYGWTVQSGLPDLVSADRLALPRLDTNEFPPRGPDPNPWLDQLEASP
jgi:peptidoglycan/xylan/chitin deacetylase (PgdA/CDA1 family)